MQSLKKHFRYRKSWGRFTGSADEKKFILDFLVEEKKLLKRTLVEYNLYRYQEIDLDNENKALMVYMYCKRGYGADIRVIEMKCFLRKFRL